MTGKSLCEMRGCVYISTQILRNDFSFNKEIIDYSFNSLKLMEAHSRLPIRLILCNASKNRLGCRNLWRHSQLQTWWTHIFFFSLFPFLFFSSRMLWLVVSLSACPRVPAMELFIHLCLRRPVLNKTRDREIALRNARMRINSDAN